MREAKIRYKNPRTLKALKTLAKLLDFEIEAEKKKGKKKASTLPITYAKDPDFMALAGIWKDKDITQEELRKKAWGGRA